MMKYLRRSGKYGLPPGTVVHVGEKKIDRVKIRVIDFDEKNLSEFETESIEECLPYRDSDTITWINIDGVHDTDIIKKIGTRYILHPLVLEDIVHTNQRPKLDDYEDILYIVIKQLFYDRSGQSLDAEQVSLVLGQNFVLSFQEKPGDVFEPVRERLRNNLGRIRKSGADYLAYALLDNLIDSYFIILEEIGESIEEIEDAIFRNAAPEDLRLIHGHRRNLILLRRSLWPLRDVIVQMKSGTSKLVGKSTGPYLRDLMDHTVQVVETLELFRDMLTGMIDLNMSFSSNRMNDIMKVLTLIATIFIPLTFIAGIYGMNFENMPELHLEWGYYATLGAMVVIGALMVWYFKSRKWM